MKQRGWTYWAFWVLSGAGILLNGAKLVFNADVQPYFVDEILNCQAATTLFRDGNYSGWFIHGKFPTGISSGIASTWIGGLVFLTGGNLFTARLLTGLFIFFQMISLIFLFARRRFSAPAAMAVAVILTSMLFHFPYWFGFMQSLGETQGALLIGWGMLLLSRHPLASFFLFGLAVWHCKFMYFPMAGLLTAAYVFSEEGGWKKKLEIAVKAAAMILLSQALWGALIWIRFDWDTLFYAFSRSFGFVSGAHSGIQDATSAEWPLARRLVELEWASLSKINRLEMLIFFFMPLVMMAGVGIRYLSWKTKWRTAALFSAATLVMLFYTYWYFYISPSMWVRQILPALYLGFALIFFLSAMITELFTEKNRAILEKAVLVTLVAVVAVEIFWVVKSLPLIQPTRTIARSCYELFNQNCVAGNEDYFKNRSN